MAFGGPSHRSGLQADLTDAAVGFAICPAPFPRTFFMAHPLVKKLARLLRLARPPRYDGGFPGPVLVLGSAPVANLPKDFDSRYTVITVNGAQFHLQQWGLGQPDITFLTWSQLASQSEKTTEVRRILAGHRTGALYVVRWRRSRRKLKAALRAIPYGYDDLQMLGRLRRMALYEQVTGDYNPENSIDTRYSNGITGVLFAFFNGAREVIISGIDPGSSGHVHGTADRARQHVEIDAAVMAELLRSGRQLYTSDPGVAERVGIPLWQG
jgi:hypothetical protein